MRSLPRHTLGGSCRAHMKLAARPALGGEMGARNAAGHETRKPPPCSSGCDLKGLERACRRRVASLFVGEGACAPRSASTKATRQRPSGQTQRHAKRQGLLLALRALGVLEREASHFHPTQNVDVEMLHRGRGIGTGVHHRAEARLAHALRSRRPSERPTSCGRKPPRARRRTCRRSASSARAACARELREPMSSNAKQMSSS